MLTLNTFKQHPVHKSDISISNFGHAFVCREKTEASRVSQCNKRLSGINLISKDNKDVHDAFLACLIADLFDCMSL